MVGLVPSCPPKCVLWTEIIILTLSTSYNCLSWSGYIRILTWGLPLTEWSDLCHVSASIREQWGLGGVQTGIQTANNRNTFAFNCQDWGQSQTKAVSRINEGSSNGVWGQRLTDLRPHYKKLFVMSSAEIWSADDSWTTPLLMIFFNIIKLQVLPKTALSFFEQNFLVRILQLLSIFHEFLNISLPFWW